MAAQDILSGASAALPVWDGTQAPVGNIGATGLDNRLESFPFVRILGSFGVVVATTELGQSLVVGPEPAQFAGTGSNTLDVVTSLCVLVDTSGGSCTIQFPPVAYAGMVVIVKDYTGSFAANQCLLAALGGQTIEDFSTAGVYHTPVALVNAGTSVQYMFDGGSPGKWVLVASH